MSRGGLSKAVAPLVGVSVGPRQIVLVRPPEDEDDDLVGKVLQECDEFPRGQIMP